jgi:AraC family transcriptional regulator, positive regulator of tynA and feaB
VIHVPRTIVLSTLGPPERLTTRACSARSPIASLVTSFLQQTAATLEKVAADTAERLCHISVSLIMILLGELTTMRFDQPAWTRTTLRHRADAFIRAHARNHALTSADVAAHLRISIRYLQDLFRKEQTTPSECIWRARLQESRRDLGDPSLAALSIGEIALRCGFLDFAHFSRRFKAAYHISAREFRLQERIRRSA